MIPFINFRRVVVVSRPINIKKSFYWNEDKIKAGISVQGNWRNQNFSGTLPQRKNMIAEIFERDFDINPFSYALGMSRTLRPRNINGELEYYRNNWTLFNILNELKNNYMRIEVLDFKIIMHRSKLIKRSLLNILGEKSHFGFRGHLTQALQYEQE